MTSLPMIVDAVSSGKTYLVRRYRGGAPSLRFEPAVVLGSDYGELSETLGGSCLQGARVQVRWLYDETTETIDWHFGWVRELTLRWLTDASHDALALAALANTKVQVLGRLVAERDQTPDPKIDPMMLL